MADPSQSQIQGPLISVKASVADARESPTLHMNRLMSDLTAQGVEVVRFGFGQSPFPIPETLVEELRRHAHVNRYVPTAGLPELREAVAQYVRRRGWSVAGPEQVVVGPGSKELFFLTQLSWDGTLLLPVPSWVSYAPQARMAGNAVQPVWTQAGEGWKVTPENLSLACREIGGSAAGLLVFNAPSNPVGNDYDAGELADLAEVARRHRLVVLSDEIYGELHHRADHRSLVEFYPEGTVLCTGLSKWCGAGGWRIGTFVFPRQLRALQSAVVAAASESYSCAPTPMQLAACRAFRGSPAIDQYLLSCREILDKIGQGTAHRLMDMGLPVNPPGGGFYLFPSFEGFRTGLAMRGITTSDDLCRALLEETGVAMLSGSCFGCPPDVLAARLAYVDFDGSRLLEEWTRVSPELRLELVQRATVKMYSGLDALREWLPKP